MLASIKCKDAFKPLNVLHVISIQNTPTHFPSAFNLVKSELTDVTQDHWNWESEMNTKDKRF